MSNTPEMGANLTGQVAEGTPVYDSNGEKVGHVSKAIMQGTNLIVHKGLIFPKDRYVPFSVIRSADSHGVYLNITKDDLQHERYTAPSATDEPASTAGAVQDSGVVVQGRGVIEQHPHTVERGVDEIEQHPHTAERGVDEIEQHPHTFERGVTEIEYPGEEP